MNYPYYQCHQKVHAAQIAEAKNLLGGPFVKEGTMELIFHGNYPSLTVDPDFASRFHPAASNYLVIFADGSMSVVTEVQFEDGFTEITEPEPKAETEKPVDEDDAATQKGFAKFEPKGSSASPYAKKK